mmetsp:Transcript_10371/g.24562  ORF Transcript_10371/g.24562 Transcript_10371/m.24562 type:complete len:281 (-) Transcript_10371:261-1103(-)
MHVTREVLLVTTQPTCTQLRTLPCPPPGAPSRTQTNQCSDQSSSAVCVRWFFLHCASCSNLKAFFPPFAFCAFLSLSLDAERGDHMTEHPSAPSGIFGIPFSSTSSPEPNSFTISGGGWPHCCISCMSCTTFSMSSGSRSYWAQISCTTSSCFVYRVNSSWLRLSLFFASHSGYFPAISWRGSWRNSLDRSCCIMFSITPVIAGSLSMPWSCSVNFFITSSSLSTPPGPACCPPPFKISTVSLTACDKASTSPSSPNPAVVHLPSSHAFFSNASCLSDNS